jgi:hypothetical protein
MSSRQIGIKYKKQIARSRPDAMVGKHKRFCKIGQDPAWVKPPNPGTVTAIKEERHRKTVEERIDLVFEMAMMGAKLSLYEDKADPVTKKAKVREDRDIRGLAACLAQANASTVLMGKSTDPGNTETESDGYIEAVRATAKNDWQNSRSVHLETPKLKAAGRDELVAP